MSVVLGSWKEIANYLGKGVRTVQRWERCNGLPVHRPSGTRKGVVLAFPPELDSWARGNLGDDDRTGNRVVVARNTALSLELIRQANILRENTKQLMDHCQAFVAISKRRRVGIKAVEVLEPLPDGEAQASQAS
jgi:hypothetical protein